MNAQQLEQIATQLSEAAQLFAVVDPAHAGMAIAVGAVVEAATKLNTLLHEIRDNADMAPAWEAVRQDSAAAIDAWEQSLARK